VTDGQKQRLGAYVETSAAGERVRAYVPAPLPPQPALELGRFMHVYERAIAAVGRLDGVTTILPSTPLFLYMYVRKEALLSSQIRGRNLPCPTCCCSKIMRRRRSNSTT
jgi:hypothetical protein